VLTKTSSGAERNSEKDLVSSTSVTSKYLSTTLPNWENFDGLLKNAVQLEAPFKAASHFNRDDFINDMRNYLFTHQFFDELVLVRPKSTNAQGKDFVIKIDLKRCKLNAKFRKNLNSLKFLENHPTLDTSAKRLKYVKLILKRNLRKMEKVYAEIQENILDKRTGVHKFENFEYWLSQKLAIMTTKAQVAKQEGKEFNQKFVFLPVNAEGFSTVNDNLGLEIGHQFLKTMAEGLMEFRKNLNVVFGIPFDAIGVHRLGGPNFIVSIYLGKEPLDLDQDHPKSDKPIKIPSQSELIELLRINLLQQKYQFEWDWKQNKQIFYELDLNQITQMIRSLITNSEIYKKEKKHVIDFSLIDRKKKGLEKIYRGNPANIGIVQVVPGMFPNSRVLTEFLDKCIEPVNDLKNSSEILDLNNPEVMGSIMDKLTGEDPYPVYQFYWFHDTKETIDKLRNQIRLQRTPSRFEHVHRLTKITNKTTPLVKVYAEMVKNMSNAIAGQKLEVALEDLEVVAKNVLMKDQIKNYESYYHLEGALEYYFPVIDQRSNPLFFYKIKFNEPPAPEILDYLADTTYQHDFFINNYLVSAHIDPLTGIPNDRALENDLKKLLVSGGALGALDIARFSGFTNTNGKKIGDQVLKKAVREMNEICERWNINLYRDGSRSEEFYLISTHSEDNKTAVTRALEEIAKRMSEWPHEPGWSFPISLNDIYQKLDQQANKYSDFKYDREWIKKEYLKYIDEHLDENQFQADQPYFLQVLNMPRFFHKRLYFVKWFGMSAAVTGVEKRENEQTSKIKGVATGHQVHAKTHLQLAEYEQVKPNGPFVIALSSDIQYNKSVKETIKRNIP